MVFILILWIWVYRLIFSEEAGEPSEIHLRRPDSKPGCVVVPKEKALLPLPNSGISLISRSFQGPPCMYIVSKIPFEKNHKIIIGVREAFLQGGLKVLALKILYIALIRKSRLQLYNFQILQGQC
jgi:hypothetical protein